LTDGADDIAALAASLAIDRFIPVGYSLGGVVAQLLWKEHRSLVDGLVLCATSRDFRGDPRERALFTMYPAATFFVRAAAPEVARGIGRVLGAPGARTEWREWIRREVALASPRVVMQAASELARFSSREWASRIDVPTAVVIPQRDKLIPPRRQHKLADAIPGATRHLLDGNHFACTEHPERFLPAFSAACESVVTRVKPSLGRFGAA
ncbi:MAG: alpha/beta hydrolase, partial [Actinomycetota bacterium]